MDKRMLRCRSSAINFCAQSLNEKWGNPADPYPWEKNKVHYISELNPFRYAVRKLDAAEFSFEYNPYVTYSLLARCLKWFMETRKSSRNISFEAAALIAGMMLLDKPLSFVTYICVSDYIGGERFKIQGGEYMLTSGEKLMLAHAEILNRARMDFGILLNWRLILADGWGRDLFGERCMPGSLELYCNFMTDELKKRGLEAVKWSELMSKHEDIYKHACEQAEPLAEKLAPWETRRGEIGHDMPDNTGAMTIAKRHIQMRAAEGRVILKEYGQTIVLSTETKKLVRYDNLLVPREDYTHIFAMPFYPHRLP